MTIDKETKTIAMNRGDRATIKLTAKNNKKFKVNDIIRLTIMQKGDYNKVLFQKVYKIIEESPTYYLTLLPDDTRFGDIISTKKEYWYEIEYNSDITMIGYDEKRAKKFILYPEAPVKEEK